MYKVGQKVVYPMHGVGIIDRIEDKEILGNNKLYYVMRLSMTDMTVMIPTDSADKVGLRGVVNNEEIDTALDMLKIKPPDMPEDWKVRYNTNHIKFKTGGICDLAEVVNNLYWRNRIKELSSSEKKLYETSLQLMIDEISLSKDLGRDEIENLISEILMECAKNEESKENNKDNAEKEL